MPPEQIPPSDGTTIVAIYGAAVATIVLVWDVYKWCADRGVLQVRCNIARPFTGEGFDEAALVPAKASDAKTIKVCLAFRVTNIGSRPVNVIHVGGSHRTWSRWRFRSREFLTPTEALPTILKPTDYLTSKNYDFLELGRITSLFALDSLDRRFYASRKDLRKVRRVIRGIRRQAK